jgi:hypothetical protein
LCVSVSAITFFVNFVSSHNLTPSSPIHSSFHPPVITLSTKLYREILIFESYLCVDLISRDITSTSSKLYREILIFESNLTPSSPIHSSFHPPLITLSTKLYREILIFESYLCVDLISRDITSTSTKLYREILIFESLRFDPIS